MSGLTEEQLNKEVDKKEKDLNKGLHYHVDRSHQMIIYKQGLIRGVELANEANKQHEQCSLGCVVGQSELCNHVFQRVERGGEFQGNQCECGTWEDLT